MLLIQNWCIQDATVFHRYLWIILKLSKFHCSDLSFIYQSNCLDFSLVHSEHIDFKIL